MKVYTNVSFTGYYPVGTSAVVVARDEPHARELLSEELRKNGLEQDIPPDSFVEVDLSVPKAVVLQDGDY